MELLNMDMDSKHDVTGKVGFIMPASYSRIYQRLDYQLGGDAAAPTFTH